MTPTAEALRTPLYGRHVALGAQMVEFGGWSMPLQYTSMREEHEAVRERAGVFDVSHMGELRMSGPRALDTLQRIVTNDIAGLAVGQARYTLVCNDEGGIIDDALVYRDSDDGYNTVVNAATRIVDRDHFRSVAGTDCEVVDHTNDIALIAVQGPRAIEILQPMTNIDLASIAYYHFQEGALDGVKTGFSRTGYTGEDGYELFVDSDQAERTWDVVLAAGRGAGILPCGLGARDTLRLEAGMRLSGQDIGPDVNPLEAGLGWAVKLDSGDFAGRDALRRVKEEGPRRAFIGLEPDGRAIARHGYAILDDGRRVGEVTSGTFSFTLGRAVATGLVEAASRDSAGLTVEVRGQQVKAKRVPLPFYKRPK